MDKSIGFKTVWGIYIVYSPTYNTTELTSTWTTKFAVFTLRYHKMENQSGLARRAFSTPWITLWFPPILPFHQLGFSWNKRISLPKLCLLGALPTRVFGRELIWPFTPIQRNRFRHHHRFSGWCFRPDQKNMIVKMGSSSLIFGVKIKSMSCHHPDYIVYWLIKKGILF